MLSTKHILHSKQIQGKRIRGLFSFLFSWKGKALILLLHRPMGPSFLSVEGLTSFSSFVKYRTKTGNFITIKQELSQPHLWNFEKQCLCRQTSYCTNHFEALFINWHSILAHFQHINCLFLNHLPSPLSLRNSKMVVDHFFLYLEPKDA